MPAKENLMVKQVLSVPELLRSEYPEIERQTRIVLSTPEIYSIKKIILTGCGDGYAACLSAKEAFSSLCQLPVDVVDPLSLVSCYPMSAVGESPCDPLVIAVSFSGRSVRTAEAAELMKTHHAMTLAITSDPASTLAASADKQVILSVPLFPASPGVRSYAVIQLSLFLLAIRIGEVRLRYTMDQANKYRKELLALPEQFLDDGETPCSLAFAAAQKFSEAQSAQVIGCGSDGGMAWYMQAKLYEAAGMPVCVTDSEQWFHVQYFLRNIRDTLTIVFASKSNPAAPRTEELLIRLDQMGFDTVLVTDDVSLNAAFRFLLPPAEKGLFHAMDAHLAAALIAGYLADLRNETYQRGFEGVWNETESDYSTVHSRPVRPKGGW